MQPTTTKVLLYGAAITKLIWSIGHFFSSVPAIHEHFSMLESDSYWTNRLTASLYLGSSGMFFSALILFAGAYFYTSSDSGKRAAGKVILLLSVLPNLQSAISVPVLTPQDSWHALPHALIALVILSVVFIQPKRSLAD